MCCVIRHENVLNFCVQIQNEPNKRIRKSGGNDCQKKDTPRTDQDKQFILVEHGQSPRKFKRKSFNKSVLCSVAKKLFT